MITTMKRGLALLLAVVISLTFIPIISIDSHAADVDYVYSGEYIYNWGTRGETATFLSPNAEDFYAKNKSYTVLSSYSGGTGQSNAPSSDLYRELKNLMANAQTYKTSYSGTTSLFKYTDCENNGNKISSFYSGKAIGPSWDSGSTWNREHTWPNSKGSGDAENDIMMLRPTSTSENSSRGNTAYGESSGYYHPNSESGGKYDLRGDVARIMLYVYVRWGNTSSMWGQSGVMESSAVLLKWIKEDPVDTWELGRNDSVESITGTRNVFVDYPELAFLLFGEEIPADMQTPSSLGSKDCGHNNFDSGKKTAATCTTAGYTIYTCKTAGCGYSYKTDIVDAKGHSYSSGTCTVCGADEPLLPGYVSEIEVGKPYKLGIYSTEKSSEFYFTGTMTGYYGTTDSAYDNAIDVYVENASGGYYIYFKNSSNQKQYINLVASGDHRNFTFSSTASSVFTWDSERKSMKTTVSGEICYIGTYGSYYTMGVIRSSKMSDTDYFARFYTVGASSDSGSGSGGGSGTEDPTCKHSYSSVVTAPTCTSGGFTTYTCTLCGDSYKGNQTSATGHSYKDGECINCGDKKPSGTAQTESEISFDNKSYRTEFSTSKQVWVMNGITITNVKSSSTVDVADFTNPVRFYAGSSLTISYPGMTKIVIDCTGLESKYVEGWLAVTDATAVKNSDGTVTVEFNEPVDSFTYPSLSKQSRAYNITVYAEASAPAVCTHSTTEVIGGYPATCTENGHTGMTRCTSCQEILDEGKVIESEGHTIGDWFDSEAANCQNVGSQRRECANCDYFETRPVISSLHTDEDEDGSCDLCGEPTSSGLGNGGSTGDNTPDDTPNVNGTDKDEDNNNVVVIVVAAAACGLAILCCAIIVLKKRR